MCPPLEERVVDFPFNCSQFTIRYSSRSMLVWRAGVELIHIYIYLYIFICVCNPAMNKIDLIVCLKINIGWCQS